MGAKEEAVLAQASAKEDEPESATAAPRELEAATEPEPIQSYVEELVEATTESVPYKLEPRAADSDGNIEGSSVDQLKNADAATSRALVEDEATIISGDDAELECGKDEARDSSSSGRSYEVKEVLPTVAAVEVDAKTAAVRS